MATHKKSVALQFADLRVLWSFSQKLTTKNLDIYTNTKTLECECTVKEINLAVSNYGAKVTEVIESKAFV